MSIGPNAEKGEKIECSHGTDIEHNDCVFCQVLKYLLPLTHDYVLVTIPFYWLVPGASPLYQDSACDAAG